MSLRRRMVGLLFLAIGMMATATFSLPGRQAYGGPPCPDQKPAEGKCNDSYTVCTGCSIFNCNSDASSCKGEVLQTGTFSSTDNGGTKVVQDGPAAVCKKRYECYWDATTSSCKINMNAFYQNAMKATMRQVACVPGT